MKAYKQIITTEPIDIQISEVTLLSEEEYEYAKDIIPSINEWWWLRSPGYTQLTAASVHYGGSLSSSHVSSDRGCVRPALRFCNLEASNLRIEDKFELAGYKWTIISPELAICDDVVGQSWFQKDWRVEDANIYENSDIKRWLSNWVKERGLTLGGKRMSELTKVGYDNIIDRIVNRKVEPPKDMNCITLYAWLTGYTDCQQDIINIIKELRDQNSCQT